MTAAARQIWMPEVDNRLPEIELDVDALIAICAKRENTSPAMVMGRHRYADVVRARVAVWRELRRHGWSYPRIARYFGRDHATIIQTLRNHDRGNLHAHQRPHLGPYR